MYKVAIEKEVKKITPYYLVTLNYMINDADEYIDKRSEFYENEFDEVIQRSIRVLDKFSKVDLRRYSNYYTHRLCFSHLEVILENKLMSEEERDILSVIILSRGDEYDDLIAYWGNDVPSTLTREVFEKYRKYTQVWDDLQLIDEGDLGYYHLESIEVKYVDENGVRHKVNWEGE